jgi:hypothetical protein
MTNHRRVLSDHSILMADAIPKKQSSRKTMGAAAPLNFPSRSTATIPAMRRYPPLSRGGYLRRL